MRKADMIDIRDILRQRYELGLTRNVIASAVGVSAGTVSNVLKRASAAGLSSWPLSDEVDDDRLRDLLYPQVERDSGHVQPDWEAIIKEYEAPRRRARLTQRQLWVEYSEEAGVQGGTAYSCSQFCALLKERLQGRPGPTQMRFDYAPGHYGMSDFSGKPLRTSTGEVVFVAVLPHSNLAEAVPDQKVCHWAMAHRRAMEYYGGAPVIWIMDNLKSGVAKADREDPQLNPTFREFAQHYDLAIIPARPGKATDKGSVESSVRTSQSRILLALRHDTFFPIEAPPSAASSTSSMTHRWLQAKAAARRSRRVSASPWPNCPSARGSGASGWPARWRQTGMCPSSGITTPCPRAISATTSSCASASTCLRCSLNGAANGFTVSGADATSMPPTPITCRIASRRCATSAAR